MATGIEMYDALRKATRTLPKGSEFTVNIVESYDLGKLKPSDLISRGYSERIANEVSSALFIRDYGPLGSRMGLRLAISNDAPPLLPE